MATFRFFDIYSSTVQAHVKTDKDISEDLYKHTNPRTLDVYADLVLVFKYKQPSLKEATVSKPEYEQKTLAAYQEVLISLTRVGLQYETRPSGSDTLFIFILCPWAVLKREATRASINDWLAGVKVADTSETEQLLQPAKERDQSLDELSESDRLRLISDLITNLHSEGGAGIHPSHHDYVDSILPLHDKAFNKSWLKSWSKKVIVNEQDLSRVRDHFGEKVAYYFEFLQYYFQWLTVPTALGILVHFFGTSFSIFYGVFVIIWAAFFTETWKRREKELALLWKVQNVSKTEQRRPSFKGTMATDPVTGEMVPFFSPWKRWTRKLLGIPVVLGGALALTTVISAVFGIEVFLTNYYDGYLKEYLIYAPMVLYSLAIPNVAAICKSVSYRLTEYENYETRGSHEYHLMQKVFIFNALTSYMSILLTAYVYIPYGPQVISTFQAHGISFSSATIDPHMLQTRLKAFMITTQAISFATETIVPWLTRRAKVGAVKIQKEVAEKLHRDTHEDGSLTVLEDSEDAKKFLKRVQKQADLPEYDINEDYAEMVLQFGYVSLFSVIWPLTGLCALVNNWVELRSDAAKISYNARRPIPSRTDTIGPWLDNLQHIAWFSSLTNASILYLFHGTIDSADNHGPRLGLGMLLFTLLVSEHAYLALRMVVGLVLDSIPTEAELDVRRREFGVKRSWLSRLGDAIGINSVGGVSGLAKRADETVDLSAQLENDFGVQAIRSNLKTN
ncbi:hypothetical protein KI688_010337 [Linnemannia hyalina]|uniref:DUF590-domain-containing protein n=1 Tax=Linnemannia hyalina TaxID=64524 RepID=A0A9P7XXZ8_9FUNG|nr:hypothetical protein KI688_010337 [Linnemannia hyalina]